MMKIKLLLVSLAMLTFSNCLAQQDRWALPDFAVVQYAGSIGYVSGGIGYDVFKSKARFSTHFGVVPPARGGRLNVVSAKFLFEPVSITVWNRVRMNPFDIGVMASYHYGDNFETRWPEGVHPKGYYWWHPAFRLHLVMEQSVTYQFPKDHRFHSATGYIEFNTNELYFVSFLQNMRSVRLSDIVKVGTGVRLTF